MKINSIVKPKKFTYPYARGFDVYFKVTLPARGFGLAYIVLIFVLILKYISILHSSPYFLSPRETSTVTKGRPKIILLIFIGGYNNTYPLKFNRVSIE